MHERWGCPVAACLEETMDDSEALRRQLASLERRFRRLQYAVGLLVIALSASALMAQSASNRVVTANQFILQDAAGVTRAKLGVEGGKAGLSIYDSANQWRAHLEESGDEGAEIGLGGGDRADWRTVTLYAGKFGTALDFVRRDLPEMGLGGSSLRASSSGGPLVVPGGPYLQMFSNGKQIELEASSPSIAVTDSDGFATQMGASDLVTTKTGTTSKTSAASLILFGKDKHVLWSTPQ
jgi:hypothetical protein